MTKVWPVPIRWANIESAVLETKGYKAVDELGVTCAVATTVPRLRLKLPRKYALQDGLPPARWGD